MQTEETDIRTGGEGAVRENLERRELLRVILLLGAALVVFHLFFGQFFPNSHGRMGVDYAFMLPELLAGDFWMANNGIAEVPWFTPSFCGGVPFFPDPQSFYYSVPQWLSFVMPPSSAAYATMLLFAALGFLGMWTLLKRGFEFGAAASEVGAILFMFNGFFASRMIVGHLTFHAFMLLPWLVAFLVMPPPAGSSAHSESDISSRRHRGLPVILYGILAGLCAAYFVHAGMLVILLPVSFAALVMLLALGPFGPERFPVRRIALRGLVALIVAVGLSASKLVASFSFVSSFQRSDYPFPMLDSVGEALLLLARSLFLPSGDLSTDVSSHIAQPHFSLPRHELEYGVGPVAMVIIVVGLGLSLYRLRKRGPSSRSGRRVLSVVALGLALVLPLALNVFGTAWHELLKSIPILKSTSVLFRWLLVYVPFVIIAAAWFLRSIDGRRGFLLVLGVFATIPIGLAISDYSSYQKEFYDPGPADRASARLDGSPPPVSVVIVEEATLSVAPEATAFPNDALVAGASRVDCYNPIFGYRLEHLPRNGIRSGAPDELVNGRLNFKNPACYVWPEANGCSPGSHFAPLEALNLYRLLRYEPYDFSMSRAQRVANTSSLVMLFAVAIALTLWLLWVLKARLPGRSKSASHRQTD